MKNRKVFVIIIVASFVFMSGACKKKSSTEPGTNAKITLTVENVSCTEAWLRVHVTDINLPANVILKKEEKDIKYITLKTNDTLVYIDSLLQQGNYSFSGNIAG